MIVRPELVEKILAGETEAARILEPGYAGSVRRYPSRWQEENRAAWSAPPGGMLVREQNDVAARNDDIIQNEAEVFELAHEFLGNGGKEGAE